MDRRERFEDPQEALRVAIEGGLSSVWTALPGIVHAFNPNNGGAPTADIFPSIMPQLRQPNGSWANVPMPLLRDCPVVFPGGGNFVLTFPIAEGDEVLILFASRCIDAWWQSGGVQPQAELRMHDLSDGFCIPKVFSQPHGIPGISTSTAQLRSLDGSCFIELAPGGKINAKAPGGFFINGELAVTGEGTFKGSHTVTQHKHGGVASGSAVTDEPTG